MLNLETVEIKNVSVNLHNYNRCIAKYQNHTDFYPMLENQKKKFNLGLNLIVNNYKLWSENFFITVISKNI